MRLRIRTLLILLPAVLAGQADAQTIHVDAKSGTSNPSWGGVPGPTIDLSGYAGAITISASGTWCSRPGYCTGPEGGQDVTRSGPLPWARQNALLGQWVGLGTPSRAFYISSGRTIAVPVGATAIRFAFNDDANAYDDNTGTVSVTVKAVSPYLETSSDPPPLGSVTHRVYGFTPSSHVVFVWSRTGAGLTMLKSRRLIDLMRPVRAVGKVQVDSGGFARLRVELNALPLRYYYKILKNDRIWIQCYEVNPRRMISVRKSNVVEQRIW